ncbi:MAG: hypothetical protein M1449_06170 [Candidatus Thermoplasmatota archaeon]|nr:hypothetical protein [Gammaproteobacteria bacterium]MCL5060112.1 hypothetical protein [Candidatus Thermoplasmatota archaeon]
MLSLTLPMSDAQTWANLHGDAMKDEEGVPTLDSDGLGGRGRLCGERRPAPDRTRLRL